MLVYTEILNLLLCYVLTTLTSAHKVTAKPDNRALQRVLY